jgi:hypothetical protein
MNFDGTFIRRPVRFFKDSMGQNFLNVIDFLSGLYTDEETR